MTLAPVRWQRCIRGAIMAAGPFFGYFLWANKESDMQAKDADMYRYDGKRLYYCSWFV